MKKQPESASEWLERQLQCARIAFDNACRVNACFYSAVATLYTRHGAFDVCDLHNSDHVFRTIERYGGAVANWRNAKVRKPVTGFGSIKRSTPKVETWAGTAYAHPSLSTLSSKEALDAGGRYAFVVRCPQGQAAARWRWRAR